MAVVELSDDETVVIFTQTSVRTIRSLDATQGRSILKRLLTIVESPAPPGRFVHEQVTGCEELEVIRAGDVLRIYCKVVDDISLYNIIYVFEIDPHRYRVEDLRRYDELACEKVEEIHSRTTPEAIESYVQDRAMTEEGLRELKEQL